MQLSKNFHSHRKTMLSLQLLLWMFNYDLILGFKKKINFMEFRNEISKFYPLIIPLPWRLTLAIAGSSVSKTKISSIETVWNHEYSF